MIRVRTLILGGGLTGLSTAWHLERRARDTGDASMASYLLVERDARLGGLTRTEEIQGYFFDHTGHWLHLRYPEMKAFVDEVMGDEMHRVARRSRIWSHGALTHFPFQANLFGLPLPVVHKCLQGAIDASLKEARGEFGPPAHFEDYCRQKFGDGITDAFMVPYNTKLWGVQPQEIAADWCHRFLPRPNLSQMTSGALGLVDDQAGYNASFVYPRTGGIETFARAIVRGIPTDKVRLNTQPTKIDLQKRTCVLSDGQVVQYEQLVSSVALPDLLDLATDVPPEVVEARSMLRCTEMTYLLYGIARPVLDDIQWLYVPDPTTPFYRIGSFSNAVPSLAPAGKSGLYVEVANDRPIRLDEVKTSVRAFLRERGWLDDDTQVEVEVARHLKYGYVVFDQHYFPAKEAIFPWLQQQGVHSLGRYGAWVYSSMEDALWDGYGVAMGLEARRSA